MSTVDEPTERTLSESVLAAVADREGVAVDELSQPLYSVVNADSLDSLFRNGGGEVTFEYYDYVVTVNHDCEVNLRPIETHGDH